MKKPAKKMPTLVPQKMRAGILKRLVTLTALGTL